MLKLAVELRQWDYAILLSGQCYPVKSNAEIESTIKALKGPKSLRDQFNFTVHATFDYYSQLTDSILSELHSLYKL